jgi:hypothetical protein
MHSLQVFHIEVGEIVLSSQTQEMKMKAKKANCQSLKFLVATTTQECSLI